MRAENRGHVPPLLRLGGGQGADGRWHTAGVPQGEQAMPRLSGAGRLALFLVRAARRYHHHLTRLLGTASVFQVPRLAVRHHAVRLGARRPLMLPARALALEREGTQRDQPVLEEQPDIGPLMTHDFITGHFLTST